MMHHKVTMIRKTTKNQDLTICLREPAQQWCDGLPVPVPVPVPVTVPVTVPVPVTVTVTVTVVAPEIVKFIAQQGKGYLVTAKYEG